MLLNLQVYCLPFHLPVRSLSALHLLAETAQLDVQPGQTPVVAEKHHPHSATVQQQLCRGRLHIKYILYNSWIVLTIKVTFITFMKLYIYKIHTH